MYKDACKLQRVLKNKYEDLETGSEEDSSSEESNGEESETNTPADENSPNIKQMRILYNTLLHFKNPEGIKIIDMFMEKPSRYFK